MIVAHLPSPLVNRSQNQREHTIYRECRSKGGTTATLDRYHRDIVLAQEYAAAFVVAVAAEERDSTEVLPTWRRSE